MVRKAGVVAAAAAASLASAANAFQLTDPHCDQLACNTDGTMYNFQWVVDETTQTLNVSATAPSDGDNTWLAIGFSQGAEDPMAGGSSLDSYSDIIIGSYSSTNGFVVRDYHTSTKTTPTLDTEQNVFLNPEGCSYDADAKSLTLSFYRALDTGDASDDKVLDASGSDDDLTLLWAYNEYTDTISADGSTLSKHDTISRDYMTGYSFSQSSNACPSCSSESTSQYDELRAACVSNGWPAVSDYSDSSLDTITLTVEFTCGACSMSKLTDQSFNYISTTIKNLLLSTVDDDSLTVSCSNASDVGPQTVSTLLSLTTAKAGSGTTLVDTIQSEFDDNNGQDIVDALNAGQDATTITAAAMSGSIAYDGGNAAVASCLSNDDDTWSATWAVVNDDTLNITISSTVAGPDGWVGIGFHTDTPVNSMGPGGFWIGSVADGVKDYHLSSSTNGRPDVDDSDDVLSSACEYTGSTATLSCTFQRLLVTGDADDVDLVAGSPVGVLFATSDEAFPAIHTVRGSASDAIDMTETCDGSLSATTPIRILPMVHGILMIISWMLLIPWGVFVARFRLLVVPPNAPQTQESSYLDIQETGGQAGKVEGTPKGADGPPLWFRIHLPVQWTGLALMVVALVVIIVDAGALTADTIAASATGGAHQIVGIVVATLALSQPVLAACRNGLGKQTKEQSDACHKKWHIIHALVGFTCLVLAFAAIALGMQELLLGTSIRGVFLAGFILAIGSIVACGIAGFVIVSKHKTKAIAGVADAAPVSSSASALPYVALVLLVVSALMSIGGVATYQRSLSSGSAAVTAAVTGDYSFCNYMPGYPVTTAETQYYCHAFEFPNVNDQQVITYKPILDETRVLHHMILYSADQADPSEGFFECTTMPPGAQPIYAWAPGNDDFTLPDNVGFDTPKYGILQVHYNNPNGLSGLVDRSGVLMNITSTKREYSAAFLVAGITLSKLEIPPEKNNYGVSTGRHQFPSSMKGKNIFSSILHMHLTGKRIWTRMWRDGEVMNDPSTGTDALGHTDAYDYNFQHFDPRDVTVQAGDELETTCIYENTVQRGLEFGNPNAAQGKTVYGGESTQEEMCISFIAYYPAASASGLNDPVNVCDDDSSALPDCTGYD